MTKKDPPPRVLKAVYITLTAYILGALNVVLVQKTLLGLFTISPIIIISLFVLYKTYQGHNWARIIILILVLIGLATGLQLGVSLLSSNPISGVIHISQITLQLIALYLLFTNESKAWFKSK